MIEVRPGARPDDLVPGDASEVERLAARLSRFAGAAGDASTRLSGLDAEHWSGRAADLFRAAVGPVPRQLSRAGEAFAAAAGALRGYAETLRAAQGTAAAAIRLVEQSTPDRAAADHDAARQMVERARSEVVDAARSVAGRLAQAAADAPAESGVQRSGPLPTVRSDDGTTVRAVSEHRLADPGAYVTPPGDLVDTMHYGGEHEVPFAGGDAGGASGTVASWQDWAAAGPGRGLGTIEPELLAGLGIAAVGLTAVNRRRRARTALARAGLDEAELRRRRQRPGRHRDQEAVVAPIASGQTLAPAGAAWRTHLAAPPGAGGTVQPWAGPEANPLPRVRDAEAVRLTPADRQVSGVVPHTGPPANEPHPGSGAR